jgi:hypothetical protein
MIVHEHSQKVGIYDRGSIIITALNEFITVLFTTINKENR